jgi:hypothetical protein
MIAIPKRRLEFGNLEDIALAKKGNDYAKGKSLEVTEVRTNDEKTHKQVDVICGSCGKRDMLEVNIFEYRKKNVKPSRWVKRIMFRHGFFQCDRCKTMHIFHATVAKIRRVV